MRRLLLIGAAAAGAAAVAFYYAVRPWWKGWGVDPAEADLELPGDDIVGDPDVTDTRGITIDAPPSAIWPWLVQMGYGRGGWYSYDRLDMKGSSADTIEPDWQHLEEGQTMPVHPGGGFLVKLVKPGEALVLYLDDKIVAGWQRTEEGKLETETPGLAIVGGMSERTMPGAFTFSWTFALRPTDDGRTRFIERFRGTFESETPGARLGQPLMGFGVFVMMQRQMVGIRDRAEGLARERGIAAIAPEMEAPSPDAGPAASDAAAEAEGAVGQPVMAEETPA
jgi:hypothetical protein